MQGYWGYMVAGEGATKQQCTVSVFDMKRRRVIASIRFLKKEGGLVHNIFVLVEDNSPLLDKEVLEEVCTSARMLADEAMRTGPDRRIKNPCDNKPL